MDFQCIFKKQFCRRGGGLFLTKKILKKPKPSKYAQVSVERWVMLNSKNVLYIPPYGYGNIVGTFGLSNYNLQVNKSELFCVFHVSL